MQIKSISFKCVQLDMYIYAKQFSNNSNHINNGYINNQL